MTKSDMIEGIAKEVGLPKAKSEKMINTFIEQIRGTLSSGGKVTITGFGTFTVSHRAARTGRNPQTGETIQIPAVDVPHFKAGKAFKEAVR
ncbi:HU family DNA-binding protein [Patescibacteria group bacterium]|nr:MAG: HU family DNA-binding protein [Patescibacteria group bacterium]